MIGGDKMKIIFLDIDGVLNCNKSTSQINGMLGIDDDKVKRLKEIVDKTGAKIVLVSTWKEDWIADPTKKYEQNEIGDYLDRKMKRQGLRILDKTENRYKGIYMSRGEGILHYLDTHKVSKFVILDDCQFDYDGCNLTLNYVKTSMNNGLTPRHVDLAIQILNG